MAKQDLTEITRTRVDIELARKISKQIGASIHWRPYPGPEKEQYAEVTEYGVGGIQRLAN